MKYKNKKKTNEKYIKINKKMNEKMKLSNFITCNYGNNTSENKI